MILRRIIVAMVLLGVASDPVHAQRGQEHAEFWPEIQMRHNIDDATTVGLMLRLRASTDQRGLYLSEQSVAVSRNFTDWFTGGMGFLHSNSITAATRWEEERLILNQVLRVRLPDTFRVDFRTQEEIRWLLRGVSVRLRERAEVTRPVSVEGYSFTPYASAEVFWDSRVRTFDRTRLEAGATFPVGSSFSFRPYLMHEINYGPIVVTRDVVGLVLTSTF